MTHCPSFAELACTKCAAVNNAAAMEILFAKEAIRGDKREVTYLYWNDGRTAEDQRVGIRTRSAADTYRRASDFFTCIR